MNQETYYRYTLITKEASFLIQTEKLNGSMTQSGQKKRELLWNTQAHWSLELHQLYLDFCYDNSFDII